MTEASLDELLDAFAAVDARHHAQVLDHLEAHVESPPPELGLDDLLARFALIERHRAILLADGGWTADLEVFLGRIVGRIDPALRAAFPTLNAALETAGAGIPGGGILVHALLMVAEGPLLSLVEGWLVHKATEIEKRRADARAGGPP